MSTRRDWALVTDVIRHYADRIAWPHSGYDPAVSVREWADRIDAARGLALLARPASLSEGLREASGGEPERYLAMAAEMEARDRIAPLPPANPSLMGSTAQPAYWRGVRDGSEQVERLHHEKLSDYIGAAPGLANAELPRHDIERERVFADLDRRKAAVAYAKAEWVEALLTYAPPDPIPAGGWHRLMPDSDEAKRIYAALEATHLWYADPEDDPRQWNPDYDPALVRQASERRRDAVAAKDYRELAARFWVYYRCEMVGCETVEPHEHGGGPAMREMTADEIAERDAALTPADPSAAKETENAV